MSDRSRARPSSVYSSLSVCRLFLATGESRAGCPTRRVRDAHVAAVVLGEAVEVIGDVAFDRLVIAADDQRGKVGLTACHGLDPSLTRRHVVVASAAAQTQRHHDVHEGQEGEFLVQAGSPLGFSGWVLRSSIPDPVRTKPRWAEHL